MNVLVQQIPDSVRLRVTGDVETTLTVPHDDNLKCVWEVASDGAGMVCFIEGGVVLEWRAEWVKVAVYDANVVEPATPDALPLFPDLDCLAA